MSPLSASSLFWWVLAASLALAYSNAFIQDDAFISFRYAANLVTAGELTWNAGSGERIEGYTNFLWVVLLALPIALGFDPVLASQALGFGFAFGTLYFTHRLALELFAEAPPALLTVVLLATNYTFSAYATGGLETQMQACWIVAGGCVAVGMRHAGRHPIRAAVLLSVLAAAGLLTRLDSALPFALLFGLAGWSYRRCEGRAATRWVPLIASLLLPVSIVVAPWLAWKQLYYGDILPNTYYAKAGRLSWEIAGQGLGYLYEFLYSYWLLPLVALAALRCRHWRVRPVMGWIALVVVAWGGYVVLVGGDFMEFRMLVPVLPFVAVSLAATVWTFDSPAVRIGLVAFVLAGSLHHGLTFESVRGIAPVSQLNENIVVRGWDEIGRSLHTMFGASEPPVAIATTAAGAIAYYSGLPTVDMHGLNDAWIARHGPLVSARPGHRRLATHRYLQDRGVNLVIGHPRILPAGEQTLPPALQRGISAFRIEAVEPETAAEPLRVLELPFQKGQGAASKLLMLYLVPHPAVDRAIGDGALIVRTLAR
jgi:hypothetical protein